MSTPNNQPTPPPGMEILTDYTLPLPLFSVAWCRDYVEDGQWLPSMMVGKLPLKGLIYAIPIHPAAGDATNEKGGEQRKELPIPTALYSCGGSCREERCLYADDLAWFPKVKLWLCYECSEDREDVGEAEITLDKYLNTRK